MNRCRWVLMGDPTYVRYHDFEWGVPSYDDNKLFEMLVLESFQAGLSWQCILKKRESFREAFSDFDYKKIACYGQEKIEELLSNSKIIRNRRKIEAVVENARIFMNIQKEWGSFSNYIWHFTDGAIVKNVSDEFNSTSSLSDLVSSDLKKRGMKFVGSVIIYSYLQAIGIINDHETSCFCYDS